MFNRYLYLLNKYIKCNFGCQRCGTSTIVDVRRLKVKKNHDRRKTKCREKVPHPSPQQEDGRSHKNLKVQHICGGVGVGKRGSCFAATSNAITYIVNGDLYPHVQRLIYFVSAQKYSQDHTDIFRVKCVMLTDGVVQSLFCNARAD